jgi:aspartate carbamoyltransferase regulatory subunit
MNNTLSVAAIKHGTVIDHILAGQALRILRLLDLELHAAPITIGLSLPSKRFGKKDIIKMNVKLQQALADAVIVFAREATINLIDDYKVVTKLQTHLPSVMKNVFVCPNRSCVSLHEVVDSHFYIRPLAKTMELQCHYCRKIYDRDRVAVKFF